MRVLDFDRVDQIDAEIAVHGFVAQDVQVLLGSTRHFVLTTQGKYLRKTNIKEQAFHQASENDQRFKQRLVGLRRAGFEVGIGNCIDEGDKEFIFCTDGWNFVVRVEDLGFVQVEAFDDVLIRSEEHTSELQSLMRISYAVFCLNKKKTNTN